MATKADMTGFYAVGRVHFAFMRAFLGLSLAVFLVAGCAKSVATGDTPPPHLSTKPSTFERVRSGIYQINAGLDSIEEALKVAKASTAASIDIKESLEDVENSIDSAGEYLAEEAAIEPNSQEPADKLEVRRKKLIDVVNDALHDLRDARGIVDSLAGETETGPLENVGVAVDAAMDDLRGALDALGGQEEVES
jgi:hypothetical protein